MSNDAFDYDDDEEGVDLGGILTLLAASIGKLGQAMVSLNNRIPAGSEQDRRSASEVTSQIGEARESLRQALELISDAEGEQD